MKDRLISKSLTTAGPGGPRGQCSSPELSGPHTCSHSLSLTLTKGRVVSPPSHPKAPSVSCSPTSICGFLPLRGPALVMFSALRAPPHCHCQASQAMAPIAQHPQGGGSWAAGGGLTPLPFLSSRKACSWPVPTATSAGRPLLLNSRCTVSGNTPQPHPVCLSSPWAPTNLLPPPQLQTKRKQVRFCKSDRFGCSHTELDLLNSSFRLKRAFLEISVRSRRSREIEL